MLTSSADSSIKIWELPNLNQLLATHTQDASVVFSPKRNRKKKTNHPIKAVCIGDMWGHSDGVYCMTPLTDNSLASCGGDGCVVLWKDGKVMSELRNGYATVSLLQHSNSMEDFPDGEDFDFGQYNSDGSYDESTENVRIDPDGFYDDSSDYPSPDASEYSSHNNYNYDYDQINDAHNALERTVHTNFTNDPNRPNTPPHSSRSSLASSGSSVGSVSSVKKSFSSAAGTVQIPETILAHVEMLRVEKKMTLQKISEQLRDQGHSENLISAVMQKQLAIMEETPGV